MNNQTISTVSKRQCRVCGMTFEGFGVLCAVHRAELAEYQRAQAAKSDAIIERRIWAERAERRARRRTEMHEAV